MTPLEQDETHSRLSGVTYYLYVVYKVTYLSPNIAAIRALSKLMVWVPLEAWQEAISCVSKHDIKVYHDIHKGD